MSHNINTITLEVNAAAELVDRETFATVFAIHNRYAGTDDGKKPLEKAVPIGVLFGANTRNYAKKVVTKGSRFVVTGELDYDLKGDKEFFTIRADKLTPIPRTKGEEKTGEPAAQPQPSTPRARGPRT